MTSALLVGTLLGVGTAWLFTVGLANHRRFVAANQFTVRPLAVSVMCFTLCA